MRIEMTGAEWFGTRPGGLNRYFESLFGALSALSDVDVRATAFGDPPAGGASWGPAGHGTARRLLAARLRTARTPEILDRHFALYGVGVRPWRRGPVQVVHFHGPWTAESAAAGAGSVPVAVKRLLELLRYRTADHLVVLSTAFRTVLVEDFDVDPARISVIAPGVDLSRFTPATAGDVAQDGRGPIVLCVRRLERRMGIHRLIEAWPAIVESCPNAELHIAGTGTHEAELRARAAEGRAAATIRFLGPLSDTALERAYAAAVVTVVPSVALEGFGLIALESLAAGTPPIVTDCGGLPDAVRPLDPSLVVQADSSEALAERVVTALQGRTPTSQECRSYAEGFGWGRVASRHLELYTRLRDGS